MAFAKRNKALRGMRRAHAPEDMGEGAGEEEESEGGNEPPALAKERLLSFDFEEQQGGAQAKQHRHKRRKRKAARGLPVGGGDGNQEQLPSVDQTAAMGRYTAEHLEELKRNQPWAPTRAGGTDESAFVQEEEDGDKGSEGGFAFENSATHARQERARARAGESLEGDVIPVPGSKGQAMEARMDVDDADGGEVGERDRMAFLGRHGRDEQGEAPDVRELGEDEDEVAFEQEALKRAGLAGVADGIGPGASEHRQSSRKEAQQALREAEASAEDHDRLAQEESARGDAEQEAASNGQAEVDRLLEAIGRSRERYEGLDDVRCYMRELGEALREGAPLVEALEEHAMEAECQAGERAAAAEAGSEADAELQKALEERRRAAREASSAFPEWVGVAGVRDRMERFGRDFPEEYDRCHAGEAAPMALSPLARAASLDWSPILSGSAAVDQLPWHDELLHFREEKCVPRLVAAILVPRARESVLRAWDPRSGPQTERLASSLDDLAVYFQPSPESESPLEHLYEAVSSRLSSLAQGEALPHLLRGSLPERFLPHSPPST